MVEIVATERGVPRRCQNFENTAREFEYRQIEGAAAEIVNRVDAFRRVVEPVGDRRRGRLVEQAEHRQSGEPCRVLGRLPLGVVEVGGHGDHGPDQLASEAPFRADAQRLEDFRRYLDRCLDPGSGFDLHHAGRVDKAIGKAPRVGEIGKTAAHQALDRNDGVGRIGCQCVLSAIADLRPVPGITHDRGQQRPTLFVGQHHRNAVAHRRDKRIGRAEIDADREPMAVGGRRLAGLGDLQERHQSSICT